MGSPAPPASHRHRTKGRDDEKRYDRRRPEESVLYGVVQGELETFLARAQARERPVPRFVERELRGFLRCGILAHGFVRVHCDDCGLDRVVSFSCKGRGFCPSCGGRRMADTAAHLTLEPIAIESERSMRFLRAAEIAVACSAASPRIAHYGVLVPLSGVVPSGG